MQFFIAVTTLCGTSKIANRIFVYAVKNVQNRQTNSTQYRIKYVELDKRKSNRMLSENEKYHFANEIRIVCPTTQTRKFLLG